MANKKGFRHLQLEDRIKIDLLNRKGFSKKAIAEEIGCSQRTVFYELKRATYIHLQSDYTTEERYNPYASDKRYRKLLKEKGKDSVLKNDSSYKSFIENMIIKEKLSPQNIVYLSKEIEEFKSIYLHSKTSIYNAIKKGYFSYITMKNLVSFRKKNLKKEKTKVLARELPGLSIEDRPIHILNRKDFGHWEMDCIEGVKGSKSAILVLTERKTRFQEIEILKEKTMLEVVKAVNRIERRYAKDFYRIFKTVTVDNGAEFRDCNSLETSILKKGKRFTLYYCHPNSPGERGSNENANKHLRRWLPKKTDFREYVSKQYLQDVQFWINYTFRRGIFEGKSAGFLYERECKKIGVNSIEYIYNTS